MGLCSRGILERDRGRPSCCKLRNHAMGSTSLRYQTCCRAATNESRSDAERPVYILVCRTRKKLGIPVPAPASMRWEHTGDLQQSKRFVTSRSTRYLANCMSCMQKTRWNRSTSSRVLASTPQGRARSSRGFCALDPIRIETQAAQISRSLSGC